MITERQEYINIIARDVFAGGFQKDEVGLVCDNRMRQLNTRAREWYMALSQNQLKRLDRDVWKRVEYLNSLKGQKHD